MRAGLLLFLCGGGAAVAEAAAQRSYHSGFNPATAAAKVAAEAEAGSATDLRQMRAQLQQGFPKWDLDSDGRLTAAELGAHLETMRRARDASKVKRNKLQAGDAYDALVGKLGADADFDQQLSLSELLAARTAMQLRGNWREQDTFGCLFPQKPASAAAEAADLVTLRFNFGFADTNGDGALARDEFPAFREPRAPSTVARWHKAHGAASFAAHDANRDGEVTFKEWMADPVAATGDRITNPKQFSAFFDTNRDGKTTLEEFEQVQHTHEAPVEMEAQMIFMQSDTNPPDGLLSYEELEAAYDDIGSNLHHKEERAEL